MRARERFGASVPSLLAWGCLTVAASALAVGCGSGGDGSGAGGGGGAGGTGGTAGDAGTDANAVCGDGVVSGGEECDNGPGNATGSGCEPDCRTSCHADADCDDGEPCNGSEQCQAVATGRSCAGGTAPAEGSACGQSGYCKGSVCTQPMCGDGVVEPGEGCEPPGTASCSADCKVMVCGDGAIVGTEQCDDGNTQNLDGCDSSCRYEALTRFTDFEVETGTAPSYCAHQGNAFGTAFAGEVAQAFGQSIQATIDGGAYNLMLDLGGLDDLTGADAASLDLSLLTADLDPKDPNPWTPTAIDGWYLAQSDMIDSMGKPSEILSPASIVSHVLTGGPSSIHVRLLSGTTVSEFDSLDTSIRATIETTPAPDVPAPPPASLAPGLKVLVSISALGAGKGLCGAVTVASLANVVAPQDFALGPNACLGPPTCSGSPTYTYCGPGQPVTASCSSMLDVLVGGCKVTALCIPAIKPTQPDVGTGSNPPATLAPGANNKVTPSVPTDGYSFYLGMSGARAHVTNNVP
jgi:cysteine-rich repeat protein